jgi:hypothetical protein
MKIYISVKNVYGIPRFYPACQKAEIFAAITNSKTLSPNLLSQIEALGYEIVSVAPSWRDSGKNTDH